MDVLKMLFEQAEIPNCIEECDLESKELIAYGWDNSCNWKDGSRWDNNWDNCNAWSNWDNCNWDNCNMCYWNNWDNCNWG